MISFHRRTRKKITNAYKNNRRNYEMLFALLTFEGRAKPANGDANVASGCTVVGGMGERIIASCTSTVASVDRQI